MAVAAVAAGLALVLALGAGTSAAKKKGCKKAKADSALTAQKCKKKRKPAPAPLPIASPSPLPPPTPPPPPVLRIETEWAQDADIDIHVWNVSGNHASTKTPNGVPGVTFSADDTGGGPGGTEQVFAQPNAKLIVGICNNGSEPLRTPDIGAAAVVDATAYEGVFGRTVHDLMVKPDQGSFAITSPDGPELPPGNPDTSNWCHPKRAELTWNNEVDVDLHVFDSAGNHASPASPYGIPGAYMTADVTGNAGPGDDYEEFIDRRFENKRTLYYYFCVESLNGASPINLWDMDLYVYDPPYARQITATQAPPTLSDHGFLASSPQSAPAFSPPNYCP